ncbi:unnamed protein product [Ambrosiozyma monospora]|uniref:peptidylprolyl isomerase n=1 Tax=Ambrosiozyma monospora TaxID=43982 RepID=A0A9W6YUI4_AMBMO|nr:unnamed protein product [Ambrosiozyma monospora]
MTSNYTYLDVSIGGESAGRIVIELFNGAAPKTTKNFHQFCQSNAYKNTYFHRVIKNFMIQGGDLSNGKTVKSSEYPPANIGKGGYSIYKTEDDPSGKFEDENSDYPITTPFLVCMANSGPNTNTSQFFISTYPSPHLTGLHTVFGKVVHGKSVVRHIEKVEVISNKNNETNAWIPVEKQSVVIDECGIWKDGDDLPNSIACTDPIGGDKYEEYPDDNEGLDLEKGDVTLKITSTIKESATLLFKQKRTRDAFLKYKKALRYCTELIPDEESDKTNYKKFLDLKKTLYLNLSLTALQLQKYQTCIDYCGFLLEMDDAKLTTTQTAKVFYRLGKAYAELKKYDTALDILEKASLFSPTDKTIATEHQRVKQIVEDAKLTEKMKYAKFFG